MDTTVCPWCHSEIVWDPELGPEEFCPHCGNELSGYRTLSIELDDEDEQEHAPVVAREQALEAAETAQMADRQQGGLASRAATLLDEAELFQQPNLSSLKTVESYGDDSFNMVEYEQQVEQLLDGQEEIPQCPHCQEYMLLSGTQQMGTSGFTPVQMTANAAFLPVPYTVNVYVCPSCFHVHQSLDEAARLHLIDALSGAKE
ncbi:hypothetical protein [Paenibacillus campi]|uniref:hypothetical protein n=1 Tax=Paenibacillus campi TaxID=3106031 RepID=UPI002AFE177F|nr:hypothetical protein [Paenibacillus sp. SGZ-1014]